MGPFDLVAVKNWNRRNQMVREIYFLENQIYSSMQSREAKRECLVGSCKQQTRSATNLCAGHRKELKSL